jgi:hypothetical protein
MLVKVGATGQADQTGLTRQTGLTNKNACK